VEAKTQMDVTHATEDVQNCYSRNSLALLNISERPDLLRVVAPKQVDVEMWVRVKKDQLYAGDLAQVVSVEDNAGLVDLKIVPRLDYTEDDGVGAFGKRKRNAVRPPARLFNESKAKSIAGGRYLNSLGGGLRGSRAYSFRGQTYERGFLIKQFRIRDVELDNVNPTVQEVERFAEEDESGNANLDLRAIAQTLKNVTGDYLAGDKVEIFKGEQAGVLGKAVAVRGEIVTLEVADGAMKGQKIDAPMTTLRKLFREGDHVKVTGGSSKSLGEVGMVVRIHDDRVTLVTDATQDEVHVFSRDLRLTGEVGSAPGNSRYNLHELVQLDATTVGCVVKVDKDTLRVLDQNGQVRVLEPSNISNKVEKRRNAVATDREGAEIHVDDVVKEWMGSQRQGHVMYVHRNFLFILNRTQVENAGLFVTTSQNVQTVAAKGGRINNIGPDLTKMNPARAPGQAPGMAPPPSKVVGRDRMIGKTVIIAKGPHKGLLGVVKDTNDTTAKVELHAKNKQLTVNKDFLRIKDAVTGQTIGLGRGGPMRGPPGPGAPGAGNFGRTPMTSRVPGGMSTGRTPGGSDSWAAGGRTPAGAGMSGGRTPAWGRAVESGSGGGSDSWRAGDAGGRTQYGGNDGSRTQYGGNDGSRTQYGGDAGNRTAYGGSVSRQASVRSHTFTNYELQAWSATARTPFASNSGFSGASHNHNDGSKTPAGVWGASGGVSTSYASGSRTPAYNSAPTPAAAAPTPYASAPTPGAYAAPTPGDMDAPTPGYGRTPGVVATPGVGYPETPGGYGVPETPGGGYEDDGPRYE
jgi:transcription elongation factor SPT5